MSRLSDAFDAERTARWQARTGVLLKGLLPVGGLWSNRTMEPFCLACAKFVPAPWIEMLLPAETVCHHCGEAVGAVRAGQ